jgi:large subunit ribosomal protein L18
LCMKKANSLRKAKKNRLRILSKAQRPRLSVFRSNKYIYGQIIDDIKAQTLVAVSGKEITDQKLNKSEEARELGKLIAKKASEAKIKKVVFDRGPYLFHGRIKAFAEGAREGGLEF